MEQRNRIKHVAIFIRISDEKKLYGKRVSEEETLKNHKEILTAYCNKNNYTYKIFSEIVSGGVGEIEGRTALKEMLDNLQKFDAILVTELSRLSRDANISAIVRSHVLKYGKIILTPEASYDLSNPTDALLYDVGNAVAVHERTVIGKRIKNNKIQIARQGQNASGSVPLGYKRDATSKKLVIDEDKAEIVRYAFKLCSEGYGASKIAQALNDSYYTTATGKPFSTRAVKEMLKIQTYKGFTVYHDYGYEMKEDKETRELKQVRVIKETVVVVGTHPAIIEPELFDSIQDMRSKRAERYSGEKVGREKPSRVAPPSLIKDLLFCECCGRKVRIAYETKKQVYLIRSCTEALPDGTKCENSGMKAGTVERDVLKKVLEHQKQIQAEIELLKVDNMEDLIQEQETRKIALEKKLIQLDAEMKGIMKLELKYEMQGTMNEVQEEFIREEKQNNINTKEKFQNQLNELIAKMNKPSAEEEIAKRKHIIKLINQLDGKSPEQVNNLLKQFIKKIHYKRVLPEELKKLGAKNPIRRNYPAEIEIEYYEL